MHFGSKKNYVTQNSESGTDLIYLTNTNNPKSKFKVKIALVDTANVEILCFIKEQSQVMNGCVHLVNVDYKLAYNSHNCYI